jgi:two-component system, response regulator RegA
VGGAEVGVVMNRVLIVDDDVLVRNALVREFKHRGLQADGAANLQEALTLSKTLNPDLAVVDLRLEAQSGLEVLRELRDAQPEVRVVMLTAYGSIPMAVQAVRLGAVDFLTKPLGADKILEAVSAGPPSPRSLARVEYEIIVRTLAACGGNVSEAARCLRIHRRSLQRKLRKRPPLV